MLVVIKGGRGICVELIVPIMIKHKAGASG